MRFATSTKPLFAGDHHTYHRHRQLFGLLVDVWANSRCSVFAGHVSIWVLDMDILDEIEGAITDDVEPADGYNQDIIYQTAPQQHPQHAHGQPFLPSRTFVGVQPGHHQQDFLPYDRAPGLHVGSSSSFSQGEFPEP